jgi:hypothetical protein
MPRDAGRSGELSFGPEQSLGDGENNPSTPFLRSAPDGRLFAIWTEDESGEAIKPSSSSAHQHAGKMAPSPLRNALLAASSDGGKNLVDPKIVNTGKEAIQGEENGPKIAFGAGKRIYVIWSIPGKKATRLAPTFAFRWTTAKAASRPARTLNEIKGAARFPIIEFSPDGNLLVAWIDRRIDNPKPRQLYLMRLGSDGQALTKSYPVGEGLCECCKLGITFADGGKTVYMVDRQVDDKQIRNHVLRKSTDGSTTFAPPVEISDDGWQVRSCPHSGPSIGRDSRGWLHVSWFTLGRSEKEAGIYYSVSKDDGKSFAPRQLVHANTAPEVLYSTLAVGDDNTVYLAWSNLDGDGKAQIFTRVLAADGRTWSPIQQISHAKGNASRPVVALSKNQLHFVWTETDGEDSRAVLRSAAVGQ